LSPRRGPVPRYVLLLVACIVSSTGGVLLAVWLHKPKWGGYGGALAVALSFLTLAVREDLGDRVFRILARDRAHTTPPSSTDLPGRIQRLETRQAALEASLEQKSKETRRKNIMLAIGSVVGTVFAALGEEMVNWLIGIR
jgi:hypothetical protein